MITPFTGTPMRESGHPRRLRQSEAGATANAVGTHQERLVKVPPAASQKASAA
jgi:hypothetical protein